MSEVQLRAHQLQQFPEKGDVIVDAAAPGVVAKQYRVKGTKQVVSHIPPGMSMDLLEEVVPGEVLRSDLDILRYQQKVMNHYHNMTGGRITPEELSRLVEQHTERFKRGEE